MLSSFAVISGTIGSSLCFAIVGLGIGAFLTHKCFNRQPSHAPAPCRLKSTQAVLQICDWKPSIFIRV